MSTIGYRQHASNWLNAQWKWYTHNHGNVSILFTVELLKRTLVIGYVQLPTESTERGIPPYSSCLHQRMISSAWWRESPSGLGSSPSKSQSNDPLREHYIIQQTNWNSPLNQILGRISQISFGMMEVKSEPAMQLNMFSVEWWWQIAFYTFHAMICVLQYDTGSIHTEMAVWRVDQQLISISIRIYYLMLLLQQKQSKVVEFAVNKKDLLLGALVLQYLFENKKHMSSSFRFAEFFPPP